MTIPSNLYAEKVFAEHPVAMWTLDEKVDYLSLISETQRQGSYSISPASTVDFTDTTASITSSDLVGVPFPQSVTKKLEAIPENSSLQETLSVVPGASFASSKLDLDQKTFTITVYVKALQSYTSGIVLGYCTIDSDTQVKTLKAFQAFSAPIAREWSMYSATFDVPAFTSTEDLVAPFISFKYINQVVSNQSPGSYDYEYLINGWTIGQQSEQFNATSLGIFLDSSTELSQSDSSLLGATNKITANQYGMGSANGMYLISNRKVLARNSSIPMVFGSSNLTRISPNPIEGKPSLIFPAQGMLHSSGRYNTYTLETWLRVDNRSSVARRILGPLFSDYGLYVDGPFLRLKIGDAVASHYVGEWYRPMLVDIRLSINSASLLINGEVVSEISFSTKDLELLSSSYSDYWGYFSYSDIASLEIDVPSVYSYSVPAIVAKRRFGYAQAVESPDGVNKSFGASTAFIDYSVADYTNNYQYPDIGKWNQGLLENIDISQNTLSSPLLSLPDFVFEDSTYDSWFASQASNTDWQTGASPYFTLADSPGFIRFNNLSTFAQDVKAAYLIIGVDEISSQEQTLLKIVNRLSGDSVRVTIHNDTIKYYIKIRGIESQFHEESGVLINAKIFVGISFQGFSEEFGGDVQTFFSRSNQLTMLIAGDSDFSSVFTGKIYKVGLCTERNLQKISDTFSVMASTDIDAGLYYTAAWFDVIDGGTPSSFSTLSIYNHIATYTLAPSYDYDVYTIDVDSDSYWQDYVPLSYFSQYVKNTFGTQYYDLDFIQFNVDYPVVQKFISNEYDTSDALVRTYVSFQPIESAANKQLNAFANVVGASDNGVVAPQDLEWIDTVYEVVDGHIIYPPSNIDFNNVALVTHIEMSVKRSIANKVNIRRLQYASQAFNADSANPIGTKFDIPIYPYQKYFAFFDYKTRNPYKIYKGSTPYLYLTKKTGIQKVGDYDQLINRGFLITVNNKSAPSYRVMSTQMFLYYDKDVFPFGVTKIFEIQSNDEYIKFFMTPTDNTGKRVRIYAVNGYSGLRRDGIAYYINGNLVKDAVININEWTALGIQFAEPIVFDDAPGSIRFTGPFLANNISYYESSSLQEVERQSYRLWDEIAANQKTWIYWKNLLNKFGQSYQWKDVLVVASTTYAGVNPKNIYQAYSGTNKIIADDGTQFYLGGTSFKTRNAISWSQKSVKPL